MPGATGSSSEPDTAIGQAKKGDPAVGLLSVVALLAVHNVACRL
jgi:hypothetical protein